ncbi:MAG: threonine synthase [Actinomycetota bacterium]|nr:threonine synthase [Actinomycetota bacterium]
MRYVSTRGLAPEKTFSEALLTGLADDGGLYVPYEWPSLQSSGSGDYLETAFEVMSLFTEGSLDEQILKQIIHDAYSSFDAQEVVPLIELDDQIFLMELFHGPTLAFKDIALQLVGRLFDHELSTRGEHLTIVGATSGDTGSAAIEACRDRQNLDIVILHPADRVSDVQRKQMTTVDSFNVHNVAIEGTFDDCQDLVKAMFNDLEYRNSLKLGAVNSINWARVMAQIVYYVVASEKLGSYEQPVIFSVPTGNFGNVFAGHAARNCGLNIPRLLVASNKNDILTQFFNTGGMEISEVIPTLSPSMDIQISSNLERLIFELLGRKGEEVNSLFEKFRSNGNIDVGSDVEAKFSNAWKGYSFDDEEVVNCISTESEKSGIVLDPHSAIGVLAARSHRDKKNDPEVPIVCLATAHPAKFPQAVERALGYCPPLPDRLADLHERPEFLTRLPNNLEIVKDHVKSCSRIDSEKQVT